MAYFINMFDVFNKYKKSITEFVSAVMILIFAAFPGLMIMDPGSYGMMFKILGKLEIFVLLMLGIFNLTLYMIYSEEEGFAAKSKAAARRATALSGRNRHFILLMIAWVIAFVSACMAPDITRAFWGTDFRVDGIFMYTVFAVLFVYGSCIHNPVVKKAIYGVYIFSFLLNAFVLLQQYLGVIGTVNEADCPEWLEALKSFYDKHNIRTGVFYKGLTGGFYNSNHVGYFLLICSMIISAMLILSKKTLSRVLLICLCTFSLWILIINNTFGCYIAAAVILAGAAISGFAGTSRKRIAVRCSIPFVILLLLSIIVTAAGQDTVVSNILTLKEDIAEIVSDDPEAENAGSGRWPLWIETVDMIKEKPLLGYGPDNVNSEYKLRGQKMTRAHNEYLEHPLNCGLPFAVFYFGGVFYIIARRIHRLHEGDEARKYLIPLMACVGYMISAFVGVFLFYTACHFFIMLSLLKDE